MVERIQFPSDPKPGSTGSDREPEIPLNKTVPPVSVEMLDKPAPRRGKAAPTRAQDNEGDEADDFEDDEMEDEEGPAYSRERIGARIGDPVQDAPTVEAVEKALDQEDVVALLFPRPVKLQDKGIMHNWEPGVHLVPVSLAGAKPKDMHWYLKAHKVRRAQKDPVPRAREEA